MKCPCCGSRQFQTVATRRICSYCRSEQDGDSVSGGVVDQWKSNRTAMQIERMLSYYGSVALRPEKVVRIKEIEP